MKNILVAAVAALTIAGLSSAAFAAPVVVVKGHPGPAKVVVVKHPAHWHQHQVCKIKVGPHHHKTKVCVWVK